WHRTVAVLALLMAPLLIALAVGPVIPYPDSVQVSWSWDVLWRESLWKQVSGYTLLGLSGFALVLSLRKRWSRLRIGGFDGWRAFHVALGVAVVAALVVHTGGRQWRDLQKWAPGIEQTVDAVAREQLAPGDVPLPRALPGAALDRSVISCPWSGSGTRRAP
ncbi:MAG: hypothetical protein ACO4BJ_07815, partial [Planctomycetota bacterium]